MERLGRSLLVMIDGTTLVAGLIILLVTFGSSTSIKQDGGKTGKQLELGFDLRSLHFPTEYHATGILSLPTSDISEPFEAWHSKLYDNSRIDYYKGKNNLIAGGAYLLN